jgi:hypothetical protein
MGGILVKLDLLLSLQGTRGTMYRQAPEHYMYGIVLPGLAE